MFWLIVLVVVVVLGALAWWSSGRQAQGVDQRASGGPASSTRVVAASTATAADRRPVRRGVEHQRDRPVVDQAHLHVRAERSRARRVAPSRSSSAHTCS